MKTLLFIFSFFICSIFVVNVQAAPVDCTIPANQDKVECKFGTISPPPALQNIIKNDPTGTGAGGISMFLSKLIALFYSVAAVVLIFMLLWGAFEWITSEGDKEKVTSARNKILSAIMGIILFAVTFAVIQVLGTFTGFKFFVGQK